MKFRTTSSDLNRKHDSFFVPVLSTLIASKGEYACPLPDDNMAHVRQELPQTYNGLSLSDVETFSSLRGMDRLHKADAIAFAYKRSLNLSHRVKNTSDFLSHYNNK